MNKLAALALLLGLGVLLGMALVYFSPVPHERESVEWLTSPRTIEAFELESEEGRFNNQSLIGPWTIVLFGFLNCPDICPTSLSQLARLKETLALPDERTQLVFVSVNPERDSLQNVARYARQFHPSFVGVTGEQTQLQQLASSLGVQFKVVDDADDFSVAHSVTLSIVDPDGMFRGRFRPGFDVESLSNELRNDLLVAL